MGNIRKQSILSSLLVYIGFLIGFINMYFYSRNGSFTPEQYGLTRIFFDFAQNMYALGALGVIPIIYKFYPYYKDNLEAHQIDIMSWSMLTAFFGFILSIACAIYFQPFFVAKYHEKSKLVLDFYFWMFPFAMGMLFFSVLEGFGWAVQESILTNFLKETLLRILTTILILLFYFKWIGFETFMILFSFLYLVIFFTLLIYLYKRKKLFFPFRISKVTRKFWKKMLSMQVLVYGGTLITSIAATIDSFIIAGFQGLTAVGIFMWAQFAANLIQVPQRSIQAVSASVLAKAWKDKNFPEINRIYARSCINLLVMALFIFGNVWLNIKDGIQVLDIQQQYAQGLGVIFILGMVRIIDAGTGLNGMVIGTSVHWRFDFFSGVVLLGLRLPLTYFLIKNYGIIGSAYAELIAYSIFNFIRFEFLRRKFNMQPFSAKTLYVLVLAAVSFLTCYLFLSEQGGWTGIILRGIIFSGMMIVGVFYFKITPDAGQLYQLMKDRFKK